MAVSLRPSSLAVVNSSSQKTIARHGLSISPTSTRVSFGFLKGNSGFSIVQVLVSSTGNRTLHNPKYGIRASSSSTNGAHSNGKISLEGALILIRHGESLWNQKNLFTGCVDVPLSQQGVKEAIEAGRRIQDILVDIIFTSALIRAQMTAMLAMTQHRKQKVPTVLHNESERAIAWTQSL